MQLNSVKTAADLPFKGIELVKTDSTISEVIVGGKLRIRVGDYGSGLKVFVEAPGEKVKRHRVTAVLEGFGEKVEHYEHSFQADEAVRNLEDLGATVTREDVHVVIDALGAVVAEDEATSSVPAELADLPF